jgi:hypothetical protein
MKRRDFIATGLAAAILPKTDFLFAEPIAGMEISVFSKTLHWIKDYSTLANTVAEMGFDGIDLTVRPEGHVLPERIETDLPKAVLAAQKAKIKIPLMVTSILQADALSELVLKNHSSNHRRRADVIKKNDYELNLSYTYLYFQSRRNNEVYIIYINILHTNEQS